MTAPTPKTASPFRHAPFNGDIHLEALVRDLRERFALKVAVETGSFEFFTTTWLTEHFEVVFTIEANLTRHLNGRGMFAQRCAEGLGQAGRLIPLLGPSEQLLPALSRCLGHDTLFYLDAHTAPQHTAIRGELEAIHGAGLRPVIVIHDFQNPLRPQFGFDVYRDGTVLNLELVRPYLDRIYGGVEGYRFGFNLNAAGACRGVLWVTPRP